MGCSKSFLCQEGGQSSLSRCYFNPLQRSSLSDQGTAQIMLLSLCTTFCLFSHLCDSILLQTDHKCIKHSPRISPHSLLCTQITIFLAVFLSSMWTQHQDWLHQVSSQCFYIGMSSFLKFKSCIGLPLVPAVSMMLQVDADADTFMHRSHSCHGSRYDIFCLYLFFQVTSFQYTNAFIC